VRVLSFAMLGESGKAERDSLQLHDVTLRCLTLVRVLSFAMLGESGKAERDSLQLHDVMPS
jgi:hypothetical protein